MALVVFAAAATGQVGAVEVVLGSGEVLVARGIRGEPLQGLEITVGSGSRRLEPGAVLVVCGVPARAVELPAAWLTGDEVVRGALAGGDAAGDRLDLLSPVLGRIEVPVERLVAFTSGGAALPLALQLPPGVGEALFQRASVGFDLVAGTLHQFGEHGVRFQPQGAVAPRWFGLQDFVALRIGDAAPRGTAPPAELVTRTGDRLGVVVRRFAGDVIQCERDGRVFDLRLADLACLSFRDVATFLSDLEPKAVAESGFDGDVVHPWRRDASALGASLVAGGRTHGKGLGVHSKSRLSFEVPPNTVHFWTRVALDDSSVELGVAADVDVRVLVGNTVKFEQQGLVAGVVKDCGLIAVRPGEVVTLEADFGKGRDIGDRVDWLSAAFLPVGGRRP